jgi:hypothetical protein
MIDFMLLAAIPLMAYLGYRWTRGFVSDRLRFVDAVQRPPVPWVAGALTALIALPVVSLLPFFAGGTALALGLGVGFGVARGVRDIRRGSGYEIRPISDLS